MSERDFIVGTVACEMYPTYHVEALKAQAVAAYTYYTNQRNRQIANPEASLQGADFDDVPSGFPLYYTQEGLKQRWGNNYDTYYTKITSAVDAVFGKLIMYENAPILAAYHAISFGNTENAEVVWGKEYAYLKAVPSPGDKLSPTFQSVVSFTSAEFSAAVSAIGNGIKTEGDASTWIGTDIERSSSGTVTKSLLAALPSQDGNCERH